MPEVWSEKEDKLFLKALKLNKFSYHYTSVCSEVIKTRIPTEVSRRSHNIKNKDESKLTPIEVEMKKLLLGWEWTDKDDEILLDALSGLDDDGTNIRSNWVIASLAAMKDRTKNSLIR